MTVCQTLKAPTQPGSKVYGALRPNNSAGLAPTKKRSQMLFSVMMRGVVEKLKPHYRQLIELRYFKEYSYEEIAQEMGLPLGTVKAQLFRARELLQNIMKHMRENI